MYPAAQLSYSYDTASTAGPEYIYNMLVTVYFDVTENPPEADPNISILEPVPGSTVEGIETISTYIVTGDSDIDIESVAFYVDGSLLGSDTEAPFQWYWDTDSAADGEHVLTATAELSSAESLTSEGVTVVAGDEEEEETSPELGSWQSTASFTQERSGHSSVVYDGYVYILGGSSGNSFHNDVQYAPINSDGTIGTWQSATPFTQARSSHTSVVHDGYIYVIGGFYSDGSTYYFNDVQYAPINADGSIGVWQSTTAYPTAYPNHTAVAYSGYVYVFGAGEVFYASINADGSIGGWQSVTSASPGRIWHTAVVQNGYVYILGGLGPVDRLNDVQYASINTNGSLGTWQITPGEVSPTCRLTFPQLDRK